MIDIYVTDTMIILVCPLKKLSFMHGIYIRSFPACKLQSPRNIFHTSHMTSSGVNSKNLSSKESSLNNFTKA